jgi:Tannase and feruloyl esterase
MYRAQETTSSATKPGLHWLSLTLLFAAAMLPAVACLAASAASATTCGNVASLVLPNATITATESVPAGALAPPGVAPLINQDGVPITGLPAFCRVLGTATPTSDSIINFEVWMPLSGWNGKFNGDGNGAYGGNYSVAYLEMAVGLQRGYAVASTDMGHTDASLGDGSWALGHPEKIIDWGYRANHLTAVLAKIIIQAFYGTPPRLSYFTGCSDGGHEALMEAQRFPDDYDGIIAGDAANFWTHQSAGWVWEAQATLNDPSSFIPSAKLPVVTAAALAACGAMDGVVDNFISDPLRCHFDPAVLLCSGADAPTCLTAPQVEAVKKIYSGPRNPRTGEQVYPGLEPGSESTIYSSGYGAGLGGWKTLISGPRPFLGGDFFEYFVFDNTNWDFHTLNFDGDIAFADAKMAAIIDSTNPDLRPFRARGGKLIMYHGWADPLVNSQNSVNYYESVVATQRPGNGTGVGEDQVALRRTQDFLRLFMVPGMYHCLLGPGPNSFGQEFATQGPLDPTHNILSALEAWVEDGVAPDKIIAAKYTNDDPNQSVLLTRPLCPYPQQAVYTGSGSTNDAANFVCQTHGH